MEIGMFMPVTGKYTYKEQIEAFKEAGIKRTILSAFSPLIDEVMEEIKKNGIVCENFHGSFNEKDGYNTQDLNYEGERGDIFLERVFENIRVCVRHNIDLLVLHISNQEPEKSVSKAAERRYKAIGDFARENGVTIVFENTNCYTENSDFLLKVIPDAKFCYDSGHACLYAKDVDFIGYMGDRLAALHISDNDLLEDYHYLPFDGNIDFDAVAKNLAKVGYSGTIMLETSPSSQFGGAGYYDNLTAKEYVKRAAISARKLADMVEKYKKEM